MQRLLGLQSYCFLVSLRFMADKCRNFEMGFQSMLLAVLFLSWLISTLFAMARLCTRGSLVCPRFALDSPSVEISSHCSVDTRTSTSLVGILRKQANRSRALVNFGIVFF